MAKSDKEPWFAAKTYGWGWGLPAHWKGWLFFILWLFSFVAGARYMVILENGILFWLFTAVMVLVLIVVCWTKGEKPGWRWGD